MRKENNFLVQPIRGKNFRVETFNVSMLVISPVNWDKSVVSVTHFEGSNQLVLTS